MVDIQAKEVIDKISEDLKIQPALQIPRAIGDKIQLVYGVNPERLVQAISDVASDSTAGTILTTHATKDTFLVGIDLSVSKDIVSDSIFTDVRGFPFGLTTAVNLISLRYEPLTAGAHHKNIAFTKPILLARNTTLRIVNNTATASIDASATVFLYEVDRQ